MLHDQPMNINAATREELLRLPFIDEQQAEEIHAYIYLHGPLQTQGELRLVPQLDSRTRRFLSLLSPTVKPQPPQRAAPSPCSP